MSVTDIEHTNILLKKAYQTYLYNIHDRMIWFTLLSISKEACKWSTASFSVRINNLNSNRSKFNLKIYTIFSGSYIKYSSKIAFFVKSKNLMVTFQVISVDFNLHETVIIRTVPVITCGTYFFLFLHPDCFYDCIHLIVDFI